MGCTLVYNGIYKGCGECLEGVNPSSIHRIRFTAVYKGCGES